MAVFILWILRGACVGLLNGLLGAAKAGILLLHWRKLPVAGMRKGASPV